MIERSRVGLLQWLSAGLGAIAQLLKDTPAPAWICVAFVVLLSLGTQSLPPESDLAKHLASEEGFFEQASAAFLIAASLLAAVSWWVTRSATWLANAVLIFYAALRELDFQTMFTYRSIMSTGYYFKAGAPLGEKLIVVLLILPAVWAMAYLIRLAWMHRRSWLSRQWLTAGELNQLRAWGIWMALLFSASHLADRHPDLLFGVLPGRSGTFEAVVESGLCLSVLFLVMELKPRFLRS